MPDQADLDLNRQQRIREEERARIARDLHDELGAQLVGIGMALGQLRERLAGAEPGSPALRQADYAHQLLQQAQQSMEQIIDDLHPPIVEFGLVDALSWQCRQVTRQSGLPCSLQSPSTLQLADEFLVLGLLRIAREALSNAVRHAKASQLRVELALAEGVLDLSISDNGQGFDTALAATHGHGLRNMRQRAQALGGNLTLQRGTDGGSVILVRVPVAP